MPYCQKIEYAACPWTWANQRLFLAVSTQGCRRYLLKTVTWSRYACLEWNVTWTHKGGPFQKDAYFKYTAVLVSILLV